MNPDDIPCGAIIGRNPRQRCTKKPVDHRGPHWDQTEDLPEGCACSHFCHCEEPA